jgi:hypothetical protein
MLKCYLLDSFLEILDPCNKENEDFILTAVDRHRASVQLSFKKEDKLENLETGLSNSSN